QAQVQDRRVEPLVLAGQPHRLVVELDADRREVATIDDGRNLAAAAKAAGRTLPFVLAALDLDFVSRCRVCFSSSVGRTASRRPGTLARDQASGCVSPGRAN